MLVGGYEVQDTSPSTEHDRCCPRWLVRLLPSRPAPCSDLCTSGLRGVEEARILHGAAAIGAPTTSIVAPALEVIDVRQLASVSPHAGAPPSPSCNKSPVSSATGWSAKEGAASRKSTGRLTPCRTCLQCCRLCFTWTVQYRFAMPRHR